MAISFKDVGTIKDIGTTYEQENRSLIPIGVKTPLILDDSTNNIFAMHTSPREQIADNFRNLLQTNWGERLALTNYGANLKPLATDYSSKQTFDQETIVRINTAATLWMPFLELIDYESIIDYENNEILGNIKIRVSYAVPQLEIKRDTVEVTLYVI